MYKFRVRLPKASLVLLLLITLFTSCSSNPNTVENTQIAPQIQSTVEPTVEPTAEPPVPTSVPTVVVVPADARVSPFVGGNQSPQLPDGDLGIISVIKIGTYDGSVLPIIVRNNTNESVIRISVTAIARAGDGSMLATGSDQTFHPNLVKSGEIAFGYIYFGMDTKLPDDTTYEFEIDSYSLDSDFASFENIRDLEVVEQNLIDNRIVGMLKNSQEVLLSSPISVAVYCFDENGSLLGYRGSYASAEKINPGDTIPFQVELYDSLCPIYLVASSGFTK